ncbi:MAG: alpha/beta hydrolase [Chthoniobacterales bacterium]
MHSPNGKAWASLRARLPALILALGALAMCPCEGAELSSDFAELNGMKVHYSSYGNGPETLVFVHGWMCDRTFWDGQVKAFGDEARAIAIDLPGHGESDKPEIDYTMQLHADAVAAVMRKARMEGATLVGHSNGTPVIREFYRRYPEKVRALVIVDGALRPFAEKEEMAKFIEPLKQPDFHATVPPFIDAMLRPLKNAATREKIKAAMLSAPQHVAVSEMEAITNPDLWRPDRINVPTLMILAKQPAWNADYEKFVRGLIPDLDYHVWPGVSHFLMLDKPEEFNAALKSFLQKRRLAGR